VPFLFYTLLSVALLTIYSNRVGWENFFLRQAERSPEWSQLSEKDREERKEGFQKIAKAMPYIVPAQTVLGTLLLLVVASAVLLMAFRAVTSADFSFKTSFSIYCYAMMPIFGVGGLLGGIILLLKEPSAIDLENLVASNAAAFLPGDSSAALKAAAGSLDILTFWALALLAIGYHCTNPHRVKIGTSFGVVAFCWLIYVFGKIGFASVFGR
jgi:hypothetical protein